MSAQTQSFLQGAVVDGKYELREYLGGSERGPVFATEFGNLRRQTAAIKLVRVRPGSAELQLSRWRLAANLAHPHLVRILDMGRCELENAPMLYVVMERADEDLSQIIPERALTPDESRDLLGPLLDVLTYMHSKGFVHTRIKPSNIMAVGEELKLSTDSICHLGESVDSSAQNGVYEPPEGVRAGVFPPGDMWSLGVTVVEVLTQKLPAWSSGDRKELTIPEDLPEAFEDIVGRCLRRDPKNRWTAPDVAAHMPRTPIAAPVRAAVPSTELERPRPVVQEPTRPEPVAVPPIRARKTSASGKNYAFGAAAAAVALFVVFGVAKLANRGRATENPFRATAHEAPVEPARQPVVEQSKAARPTQLGSISKPVAASAPARKEAAAARAPAEKPAAPASASPRAVDLSATRDAGRGSVVHEVVPEVPRSASATITGTVRVSVKVSVDASGNVTEAVFDAPGPSRYFSNLSLRAARDWKFTAPSTSGASVASTWVLHFGYTNSGAKATATQTSP